jgi:hypothetical protein
MHERRGFMRLRITVAASLLAALVAIAIPGVAAARIHHHPRHNNGLTINAVPDPIIAGDGVLVYGQLKGSDVGGQTIRLYHHIDGRRPGYSVISTTRTNSSGWYEFFRPDGLIYTNRDWFARGPNGSHSRTVRELVQALVTVNPSTTSANTGQRVTFTGAVTPNHAFQRVRLQEQDGSSDQWHTLKSALLGPGSNYAVAYAWKVPGDHDVRVVLPGDARNIRSMSNAVTITVQQKQVAGFTINSSQPVVPFGQSVMISGVLTPGGTAQPATVQLWGHPAAGGPFQQIGSAPVSGSGDYTFTEMPTVNTVYQVRATLGAHKHSALLWQGVRDVLGLTPSSNSSTVGGKVTFNGTVLPTTKTGDTVYLERLGANGNWQPVEAAFVTSGSTFKFGWRFSQAGTFKFRARIYSDHQNVGTASTPVTITVSGNAPVSSLPPAS